LEARPERGRQHKIPVERESKLEVIVHCSNVYELRIEGSFATNNDLWQRDSGSVGIEVNF
jgi:hypothetical protein